VRRGLAILAFSLFVLLWVGVAMPTPAQEQSWTGFVTDTHCGTNCQLTKNMTPDLHCIRECVRKGSKYGLWSGNKVYVLEPQDRAAKFAAKNVRVSGKLDGETIHFDSIEPVATSSQPASQHNP
jgi:hypothetical protein